MVVQTRRQFLTTLSLAVAGGLIGQSRASGAEGTLETTTLRFTRTPALCASTPLYVAEELLRAEGFSDIRYVDTGSATDSARTRSAPVRRISVSTLRLRLSLGSMPARR